VYEHEGAPALVVSSGVHTCRVGNVSILISVVCAWLLAHRSHPGITEESAKAPRLAPKTVGATQVYNGSVSIPTARRSKAPQSESDEKGELRRTQSNYL
jgi:hypothetical protein